MNPFGALNLGEASKIIKGIEKCTPLLKAGGHGIPFLPPNLDWGGW